jgi:hypothetical protein
MPSPEQPRIIASWSLSAWRVARHQEWEIKPVLTIDGQQYAYSHPNEFSNELLRRWALAVREHGIEGVEEPLGLAIRELKLAAPWFATIQSYSSDTGTIPPSAPTRSGVITDRVKRKSPPPVIQPSQQALQTSAQQLTPQTISNSSPIQGMALKLKRSERTGTFGKLLFALDARMDMSAENRALIAKYNLGDRVIYESAAREARTEAARQHLENSRDDTSIFDSPGRQALGIGKSLFRLGRAAISATAAALSLRITVDGLIAGVHVECKDMNELMEAEEAITEAARNLKAELGAANTFTGQEQVIDL